MNSSRTRVRRHPSRGRYSQAAIFSILDEAFLCHVCYAEDGQPSSVPMLYGRREDRLLVHGSTASRTTRALAAGANVCVVVTLIDGVVFARSAFSHSANYRSVVIYGKGTLIVGREAKLAALKAISDHMTPGRWEEAREPDDRELQATSVIEIPLSEASAKIRMGGPEDDDSDLGFQTWAGHVPLNLRAEEPIPHDQNSAPLSAAVSHFTARFNPPRSP